MNTKRLTYAMIGGAKGSFIGPIHRMAIRLDDLADLAAGCFSRDAHNNAATGAKLRLDYPGTIRLDRLELGGRGVSGTVTAARYPDYISGPGAVEVRAKATVILFR